MHSTTICRNDAFRKKKITLVKQFSIYGFYLLAKVCIFITCVIPIHEIHSSQVLGSDFR